MKLLSIDPGYTTGVALLETHVQHTKFSSGLSGLYWEIKQLYTFRGLTKVLDLLDTLPDDPFELIVLVERIQEKTPGASKALKVYYGILNYLTLNDIHLESRSPSLLQGPYKWDLNLPVKPSTIHEKDALLHAIVYVGPEQVEGVSFNENRPVG
jgi:hypothetical protein